MRTENLLDTSTGFSLDKIYFLCKNEDFWVKCIDVLRKRCIYDDVIWCFAFKHCPTEEHLLREYMFNTWIKSNESALGPHFDSKLISARPRREGFSKFLEYNPMINARAHSVGKDGTRKILNKTFRETYDKFLTSMLYK